MTNESLARAYLVKAEKRLKALAVLRDEGAHSDVDLLIVARDLPRGRLDRVEEFLPVEANLEPLLQPADADSITIAPVFKTPAELEAGSPLLLDMVDDARILDDSDGVLDRLRARLAELGARRVPHGGGWYWELKPDLQPGEVFRL